MAWARIQGARAAPLRLPLPPPLGVRAHPARAGLQRKVEFEVAEWLWQNSGKAHLAALDDLIALLHADSGATFWTMKDFAAAWQA